MPEGRDETVDPLAEVAAKTACTTSLISSCRSSVDNVEVLRADRDIASRSQQIAKRMLRKLRIMNGDS